MEAPRVALTEEDIRERVTLRHQNLADVRTLSLPGTYHEKITYLGSSLKNFIRLKSLDLSRNALTSLEGLQHLTCLEKLNLYFNHISSLSEVFRLQTLTDLQELDFRLNPVMKNESDYRLFVVHMLPNLRQLDDRPVRDRERKASLLHFTPEQAYEFKKPSYVAKEPETGSAPAHSRAEYVYSLSKKCSVMDEDDEAVLNLIAKCEWDLSKPAGVTGSAKRDPEVQFHVSNKWRHLPDSSMSPAAVNQKSSVSFLEAKTQEWPKRDPNLMFRDEAQTYGKVKSHANFTPHPGVHRHQCKPEEAHLTHKQSMKCGGKRNHSIAALARPGENEPIAASEKKKRHHRRRGHEPQVHVQNNQDMPQAAPQSPDTMLVEEASMECLLDLVDKYWNGCRSLHCNEVFLSQAGIVLSAIQKGEAVGPHQLFPPAHQAPSQLLLEKKALQEHLFEQEEQYSAQLKSLKAELSSAKKDLDILKQHLHQVLEENEALKACYDKAKENASSADATNGQQLQITTLQNQNQLLTKENTGLKQHLQHFTRLQELTQMLQESHKTLVSTNERLLRELDEARSRHKAEVEELHWSYNQLKKTIDQLPSDKADSSKG